MTTRTQQRAITRGMAAAVERSNQKQTLTLQFDWAGGVTEESVMTGIHRLLVQYPGSIMATRIRGSELTDTRAALERSEAQVEQFRQQVRDLTARLDMQPPAASSDDTAISLTDWAESLGVSYSTAWRYYDAGRVEFRKVGGGKKHNNVLVFPETFVPPVKGKKS